MMAGNGAEEPACSTAPTVISEKFSENKRKRSPGVLLAIHEAGHTAMCIILGLPFSFVTIEEDGGQRGYIQHPGRPPHSIFYKKGFDKQRTREWLQKSALMTVAGQVVEQIFIGWTRAVMSTAWNSQPYSDNLDLDRLADELSYYSGWRKIDYADQYGRSIWRDRVFFKTYRLLRQRRHWRMVEALAQALLETGTLTSRQARRIAAEASR